MGAVVEAAGEVLPLLLLTPSTADCGGGVDSLECCVEGDDPLGELPDTLVPSTS